MRMRNVSYCFIFFVCYLFIVIAILPTFALATTAVPSSQNLIIVPDIHVVANNKRQMLSSQKRFPRDDKSLSGATRTILTRQLLSTTGVNSLQNALQNLAGVTLQDTVGNGSQTSVSMRGFGSNASSNTLVLINGIPLTNPDLASANLNTIPLSEIEMIEVIAGTESVLYGDQAVGGIVNILTRHATAPRMEMACDDGSFNQFGCHLWLANRKDNTHFYFAPLLRHSDNYREHNDYDQSLLSGGFEQNYLTGYARFDYVINGENMQFPGALSHEQVVQNRRQSSNNTDFFKDWSGLYHLQIARWWDDNWQSILNIARREMHGRGVLFSPFTQARLIHFAKLEVQKNTSLFHFWSGGDFEDDDYHINSAFGPTVEKQQKMSGFGLINFHLPYHTAVAAGLRGAELTSRLNSSTNINTINRALATTLGIRWQLHPSLTFHLRRAENYRFPKADENAFAPNGVTSLRTQRGVSYETGAEWISNYAVGKINLYELLLRDEIAFDPTQTPTTPFGANQNLSPTKRYGLSLGGKIDLSDCLTIDSQYHYVNARFQNGLYSGKRIPLVPEHILRAGLLANYHEHWRLYAEAIYTGNQFAANDYANIAGRIGGYTLYNFNLQYHQRHFMATLRIDNAFNKAYYFYTVYRSFSNAQYFYPAPTRSVIFSVQYRFI